MNLRIWVFTLMSVRALALWNLAPYNLVERWRHIGGAWCFEGESSGFVRFWQTTRCHIPENSSLHVQIGSGCLQPSYQISARCRETSDCKAAWGNPRTVTYAALEVESGRFLRNVGNCIPVRTVLCPGSLQLYVNTVVRISSLAWIWWPAYVELYRLDPHTPSCCVALKFVVWFRVG